MSEEDSRLSESYTSPLRTIRDKVAQDWPQRDPAFMGVGAIVGGMLLLSLAFIAKAPVFLVVFGAASITMGLVHLFLKPKTLPADTPRVIEINEAKLSAWTFGGEKIDIGWEDVSKVNIGKEGVKVISPDRYLTISKKFPRFGIIREVIRKACKQKGIESVENSKES